LGLVWKGMENLASTRVWALDCPTHSKLLHQLSYPAITQRLISTTISMTHILPLHTLHNSWARQLATWLLLMVVSSLLPLKILQCSTLCSILSLLTSHKYSAPYFL
jgi:hypothetical protein